MVYGVLKLINFAHDAVFALGGITVYYVIGQWFGLTGPWTGLQLIFMILVFLLVGGIGSALGAVALERVAYRPLRRRGASRLSYLISAIGASFFLSNLALLWRGREYENFPRSLDPAPLFNLGRVPIQTADIVVLVAMVVMMVGLDRFVQRTRTGKGIRAVAQDVETAGLMGVDINRMVT